MLSMYLVLVGSTVPGESHRQLIPATAHALLGCLRADRAPPPSRLTSTIYGLVEVGNYQSAIQKVRKPVRSPSCVKRLTPPYQHTMVLGHQIYCSYLETWFRTFSWKCLHGSQVFGSRVVTSNSSNFESSVKRLKFWRTFGEHLNVPHRKGYNANLDLGIKGYCDSVNSTLKSNLSSNGL